MREQKLPKPTKTPWVLLSAFTILCTIVVVIAMDSALNRPQGDQAVISDATVGAMAESATTDPSDRMAQCVGMLNLGTKMYAEVINEVKSGNTETINSKILLTTMILTSASTCFAAYSLAR